MLRSAVFRLVPWQIIRAKIVASMFNGNGSRICNRGGSAMIAYGNTQATGSWLGVAHIRSKNEQSNIGITIRISRRRDNISENTNASGGRKKQER